MTHTPTTEETMETKTLQIGDILSGSWGYDQTNPEFFEVIGLTPKGFVLREIKRAAVNGTDGFMCNHVMPRKGEYTERPAVKVRYSKYGALKVAVSPGAKTKVYLSKWDGKAEYNSWYA